MPEERDRNTEEQVAEEDAEPQPSNGRRLRGTRERNTKLVAKESMFEKLRRTRNENKKHKYEGMPVDPLYQMVTEEEYSKMVQERQESDWIERGPNDVDDYYDNGLEMFDDEDDVFQKPVGKKGKAKKTKGRFTEQEEEDEKRPGVRATSDIRNFLLSSSTSKPKPKENTVLSKRNEIILEQLFDELEGVPEEAPPPEPSRFDMLFGASKSSKKKPTFNTDQSFGSMPSTSKHTPYDTFPDFSVSDNFASEPDPSAFPVEIPPIDKGTKRMLMESPRKVILTEEKTPAPVRLSILTPKITTISMDRSRKTASANSETVKKTKPNTPKKNALADDWIDDGWEPDADLEKSIVAAENLAEQISNMDMANAGLSRIPKITSKFGDTSAKMLDKTPDSMVAISEEDYAALTSGTDGGLKFYCLDIYEDSNQPGCVFLFGKVLGESKTFISTCIKVANIDRKLFFCLREKRYDLHEEAMTHDPVDYDAVKGELARLKQKYKMSTYRFAEGVKKYCFNKVDVPDEVKVLEVRYPFTCEALPDNLVGETFSEIFGRNTTALEIFLLDRKLKGPCWLNIAKAEIPKSSVSWCQREFIVEKPIHISVIPNMSLPHVTVMAIHLRVVVNSRTKQNEIVGAALLWHKEFPMDKAVNKENVYTDHLMLISHPSETVFPFGMQDTQRTADLIKKEFRMDTKIMGNERHLLSELFTLVQRIDPDFLVFHDGLGFQLEVLLHRASQLSVPNWSRLGRLQRRTMPKGRHAIQITTSGRLVCDVRRSAEELIHAKSYDLNELVSDILKQDRQDVDSDIIKAMYRTAPKLIDLISLTLLDAKYVLQIMAELDAIPLAREITTICGNTLSRTLLGGRSERNEFLLLHAFTSGGYICPDKEYRDFHKKDHKSGNNKTKVEEETREETDTAVVLIEDEQVENEVGQPQHAAATSGKRKPAYAGGLVLDPKKGLHDSFILLMDFNSLYPSIILEYNICFTTVDRACLADLQDDKIPDIPSCTEQGILPAEISRLVNARRSVKQLIEKETNPEKLKQYDIRQKGLKLTANSMYGCLGFANSRFFARPLAALITSQGREILKSTKDLVEKMGLEVIYGDTDSIMINTRLQEYADVVQRGNEIRSKVGKLYKCLDLGIDGIFRKLLLLQKKKYAALVVKKENGQLSYYPEVKGLDIVRRDWSNLARDAGRYVVEEILRVQPPEVMIEKIQSKLRDISAAVNDVKLAEINPFVITKQLTKDPSKYADVKSQPHVQVAQRWNKSSKNAKQMTAGDVVPFVICNEAPAGAVVTGNNQRIPHTQRAYHVEEVLQSNGTLTIDKQYYLAEQVHKVVNRVCEFVEGLDSAIIAECLGVDRSLFPHQFITASAEDAATSGAVPDSELYQDCQPLMITCSQCREKWEFGNPVWEKDGKYWLSLQKCPSCDEIPLNHFWQIRNGLQVEIGKALQRYYKAQFTCEEASCHFCCSFIPPKFHRGRPVCPSCNKSLLKVDFSERDLYLQLCYWKNAFDPVKAMEKVKMKAVKDELASALATFANGELDRAYGLLMHFVKGFIDKSAYGEVRFSDFFHKPPSKNLAVKLEIKEEEEQD